LLPPCFYFLNHPFVQDDIVLHHFEYSCFKMATSLVSQSANSSATLSMMAQIKSKILGDYY
ncbi:hypothetical protein ABHN05_07230, partial [Brevibacillus laterosporus]|uniref:hypothetical protein n=1 Tax=Brevibacillus laterosporus TaxID=1465 RepID=UPI003D1E4448